MLEHDRFARSPLQWLLTFIIAALAGYAMYSIVLISAWNLARNTLTVYPNRMSTWLELHRIAENISEFEAEHGELPHSLTQLPLYADLPQYHDDGFYQRIVDLPTGESVLESSTQYPIFYKSDGSTCDLYSPGKDRKRGGAGIDSDIESTDWDQMPKFATYEQFMTATDGRDVARSGFDFTAIMTGSIVFLTILVTLAPEKRSSRDSLKSAIMRALIIVGIATAVGIAILPHDIPNGH